MTTWRLVMMALALIVHAGPSWAADWPQWRGPNRDGISAESGLLRQWPAEGPRLIWQVTNVGDGYSTPAVVGDRVFLLGNDDSQEFAQAITASDGKQLWSTRMGTIGRNNGPQYPGARSTPTVDGELVYALGSDGDLVCLTADSGEVRWRKNLRSDFGGEPGNWAYAESPLVDGNLLICTPGGASATLVALDKNSGEVAWKSPLPDGDQAGYASAITVEIGGVKQFVQFLQKGLVGLEAASGKLLWRYGRTAEGSTANIPTPVCHDDLIYSAAGRSGGGLVQLKIDGAMVEPVQLYYSPELPTSIGGSVHIDGFLYGTNSQGLMCVQFTTGEAKWHERGIGPGAVCYADQCLYVHGENGDVALVDATPEAYREKGRFSPRQQPDRGRSRAWTYPVVANGRLYIRDLNVLWCYDVQADQTAK